MRTNRPRGHRGEAHIVAAFRFLTWAQGFRRLPDVDAIKARFGVGRSTAYRWRAALAEVRGIA